MALKNRINQLIRDEWNKSTQLNIWDSLEDNQKNGSCVTSLAREMGGGRIPPPTLSPTHEPTHERSAEPTHEPKGWVQEYKVTSHGKEHKYYRYCYLEEPGNIGSCVRVHLPGGNVESARACALKEKVETAIAQKLSHEAIVEIIKSRR